ncbi:hypothetical protein [Synechococcus sp. CBW1006]|uniref:hypothetical protein n=1 Tax=Synechococcus sp. CBW1006 TaxID=1353138 RepID=UPI0018CD55FB|nr:hypothetical protein [Synechococcus sp. CBW1006]QPN67952.1 hypothetical protein H8F26_07555 [Synechococcus sp. CBW1006]
MRLFHHDARSLGPTSRHRTLEVASQALALTEQGDRIQMPKQLQGLYPMVTRHFRRAGLEPTQDVIWGMELSHTACQGTQSLSCHSFGQKEHEFFPDPQRLEATRLLANRRKVMRLVTELGLSMPETICLNPDDATAEARIRAFPMPCWFQPERTSTDAGVHYQGLLEVILMAVSSRLPVTPAASADP